MYSSVGVPLTSTWYETGGAYFYRPSPEPTVKLCKFKTLKHFMLVEYVVAK